MSTVGEILRGKGRRVHVIRRDASVLEAASRMVALKVGSLLVIDETLSPCGLCTERDYLEKVVLAGRDPQLTRVSQIMSSELLTIEPSATTDECMRVMSDRGARHLPVLIRGRLVGLVSQGDVMRHLVTERTRDMRYLAQQA